MDQEVLLTTESLSEAWQAALEQVGPQPIGLPLSKGLLQTLHQPIKIGFTEYLFFPVYQVLVLSTESFDFAVVGKYFLRGLCRQFIVLRNCDYLRPGTLILYGCT